MSVKIVYPGSFRPFHLSHLKNVINVCNKYKKCKLIIAVSKECKRSGLDINTTIKIIKLSIPAVIANRVSVVTVSSNPIISYKKLADLKITHVITGSSNTISVLKILKKINLWNGNIIKLNNSGIHATKIRELIYTGSNEWKKYIAQPAVSFLEAEM